MTNKKKTDIPDKLTTTIIRRNTIKTVAGYLLSMVLLGYFTYWLMFSITHQDDVPQIMPITSILLTGLMFTEFMQYGYTVANIKTQQKIQKTTIDKHKEKTVEQLAKEIEKVSNGLQKEWSFQSYWEAKTLQDMYLFKRKMTNQRKDN